MERWWSCQNSSHLSLSQTTTLLALRMSDFDVGLPRVTQSQASLVLCLKPQVEQHIYISQVVIAKLLPHDAVTYVCQFCAGLECAQQSTAVLTSLKRILNPVHL